MPASQVQGQKAAISGWGGVLRRSLTTTYLAGSQALTHMLLGARSGAREFSRIVVVAALERRNGIASGARLQWAGLRALGMDVALVDATAALRNPLFRAAHRPGTAYVFHAAGPQTAQLIASVLPHAATAYRIGYWAWELPDPPRDWAGCDRQLSEIWTPSKFSQASLAQLASRPVEVVPHCIPAASARQRTEGGPFTVLVMADSRSSWSRKNPEGALRAFRAAFAGSKSAKLVLKLNGRPEDIRAFETSLADLLADDTVEIVRGHLDEAAMDALYYRSDVLLSLHRAEGYGLPMHEAMAHGVPVVATAWSGNTDFMDASDSCLVPYRLVPVSDAATIYGDSVWAEPDVDAAAELLRRLADDQTFYARLAAAAYQRASDAEPRFPFSTDATQKAVRTPIHA